jgi:hypothetical protein
MPWQGTADMVAGNLAFTHLAENLPIRLAMDGRLHAETLLAAAGAVCGYACQRALLERVAMGEVIGGDRLLTLRGANGFEYYAGDALNEMFYGGPGPAVPANTNLWRLLNGTAQANGLAPERLPTGADIFSPMAATLGQADEGRPSTGPDHQPQLPIDKLLNAVWPLVQDCLIGRFATLGGRAYPAPVRIWPAVTAWAAVQCFGKTLPILDPRIGVLIVMQSAAFASKLDSKRVEASGSG